MVEWFLDFRMCVQNSGTSICVHSRKNIHNFFRYENESGILQI